MSEKEMLTVDLSVPKKLITVEEWTERVKNRDNRLKETGVLCPQCQQAELLWDFTINLRLDPPMVNVECSGPKCTYKGRMRR